MTAEAQQCSAEADDGLAPEDLAWRARRSTLAPLAFGVIGLTASPLLLGLVFGPIGLRAGIDLWRSGIRRGSVVVGISASMLAVVCSVIAAVLWGSVLAGVLLTRDALRETERWVGMPVPAVEVAARGADGDRSRRIAAGEGRARLALVFITPEHEASDETLRILAELSPSFPSVGLLVVGTQSSVDATRRAVLHSGLDVEAIGGETALPAPIDAVAITPTIVVIDRDGRIESAASGGRPAAEIKRMLEGPAASMR